MSFKLPQLPYAYDSLEPFIDARTMEIHHSKHHAAYTNNLNTLIEGTKAENLNIEEIMAHVSEYPAGVRNNGDLLKAIEKDFGSFEAFREKFSTAAATRFGSGWAWLVLADGKLVVTSSPNQDNPLMDIAEIKGLPLLALDVWEHAYYLNYQNRRPEYIDAFWHLVNWDEVSRRLAG